MCKRGSSLHSGKWEKGSPKSFSLLGNAISGHVAIGAGMGLLISIVTSELPQIVKELDGHVEAHFNFSNESSFEEDLKPDLRDEAYEREMDRKWRDS